MHGQRESRNDGTDPVSADDYYRALDARYAIYCHACRNGHCEDCWRLGCTCCNSTTGDTDD